MNTRNAPSHDFLVKLLCFVFFAFLVASFFSRAEAVPAFGRQLNVKCQTCHTPVPPRLNNVGITFRRMGYRMPDSDDDGNLILTPKPSRTPFDDFSLIGDFRAFDRRTDPFKFELHEAETFGGGAIGKYLSYTAEVEWEEGEFELGEAEGHVLLGEANRNFTARGGLISALNWEKGNHQRLSISRPLLFNNRVPIGVFSGFRLRDTQVGVELGFNFNHLGEEGQMRNTFLSLGVFNGITQEEGEIVNEENNSSKDIMIQATQLWGSSNTVSFLYYRGEATLEDEGFTDEFSRLTIVGNYRLETGTDLVAGFGRGTENPDVVDLAEIDSNGYFVEVDQAIKDRSVVFGRYDRFERNQDDSTKDVRGYTLGFVHHILDNLLATFEYQSLRTGSAPRTRDFTLRLVFTY